MRLASGGTVGLRDIGRWPGTKYGQPTFTGLYKPKACSVSLVYQGTNLIVASLNKFHQSQCQKTKLMKDG
jgi:hypothetical protein